MSDTIILGDCTFDRVRGVLTRDGAVVPLTGRALALLTTLAASDGTLTKEALLEACWPGVTVEEGNLAVQIGVLRRLLGDDAIATVPRVGYRLRRDIPVNPPTLPLLAILPFEVLGTERGDAYFADGLAEDLIAALGRFRQFAVLSRQAAISARGSLRAAGPHYVLDGSLRRLGDRLRISAHLSDVMTGQELWACQLDGGTEDLFAFQDRITVAVATAVAPEIEAAQIAGAIRERSASMTAYDLFLRALPEIYGETEPGNLRARELLDRALATEPQNPLYLVHAAWVLQHRSGMGWVLFDDDHRDRCVRFARRALALARGDARVLVHAAMSLLHMRDYDLALAAVERAERENPNSAHALLGAAVVHLHLGDLERIPELIGRMEAINVNDPLRHIQSGLMAGYHLLTGDPHRAAARAAEGLARQPNFSPLYWMMVGAQVALGQMDVARRYVDDLRANSPGATVASIRDGQPRKLPERIDPILAALAAAGLPERAI